MPLVTNLDDLATSDIQFSSCDASSNKLSLHVNLFFYINSRSATSLIDEDFSISTLNVKIQIYLFFVQTYEIGCNILKLETISLIPSIN